MISSGSVDFQIVHLSVFSLAWFSEAQSLWEGVVLSDLESLRITPHIVLISHLLSN